MRTESEDEGSGPAAGRLSPEGAERRGRPRDPRVLLLIAAVALVASACGLGFLLALRRGDVPGVDTGWMTELATHRAGPITDIARVFDWLGGGVVGTFVVPIAVTVALIAVRRYWAALFWVSSVVVSAGIVQAIKNTVDRARPSDMIVVSDHGSFPSGHTANAATLAVVLAVILWRWWVSALGVIWTVAMAFSRTYLGAHWLSDTLGGVLVGAGVALAIWGILSARLEQRRWHGIAHRGPRGRSDSVGT